MTPEPVGQKSTGSTKPVVLITGCSSGIGRATACRFARAGYRVFAGVRRPGSAESLEQEARIAGWALQVVVIDVSSDAQVAAGIASVLQTTCGRIDVLVNNAGYYLSGPVEHIEPAAFTRQLDTNLVGVLRTVRAVMPAMRAAGRGHIINLSSISGVVALPVVGPYHASKAGLEGLSEVLRYEARPFGIRVTIVEPGPVETAFYANEIRCPAATATDSPYRAVIDRYEVEQKKLPRTTAEAVANVIYKAARRRSPPLRVRVGPTSFSGGVLRRFVPDRLFEWAIAWVFSRPVRK